MHDLRVLLRRYLTGVWRRRWIAVGVAWLVCVLGWGALSLMPNVYEADARLYVDADAVLTPLLKGLALDNNSENQVQVLQRTLLSRPNLETLISKTDLSLTVSDPAERERLVAKLGQQIDLQSQADHLFSITYRSTSPQLAYDVVQTLLNIFIESRAGNSRSDMENARAFLQRQIDDYETKLRAAERARAEFKTRYVDLLPSETGGSSRLEEARAQVLDLQGKLTDAIAKRGRLQVALAATPELVPIETDPAVAASGGDNPALAAAETQLAEMRVRDTDANPEVIIQKRLIAQLRKAGGGAASPGQPARTRSMPNPAFAPLKVELVDTEGEIASLTRQVADATRQRDQLEQIARTVPGLQAQYQNLDRDYDVVRKNYDELIARREEMRIAEAADSHAAKVKLQVVDPPLVPRIPSGPKRVLLMTAILVVGLGAGIGAAGALVRLDRSFLTLDELRSLNIPVAGSISLAASASRGLARMVLRAAMVAAAFVLLCGVYGGLLWRVMLAAGKA